MEQTPVSPIDHKSENTPHPVDKAIAGQSGISHDLLIRDADSPGCVPAVPQTEANRFLFIASDWRSHMIRPGGIVSYIDGLAPGLGSFGDSVRMLAVVRPDENVPIDFLGPYEPWAVQFQLVRDGKPVNWLGRKFASVLDTLRCLSPTIRHMLKRTSFFAASDDAIARLERVLAVERPTVIVFVNFDPILYSLALSLLENRRPFGIIAHGCEISRFPKGKTNLLVQKGTLLKGATWIAANSRHTDQLLRKDWGIPPERIKIIHPPIPEAAIRESAGHEPVSRADGVLSLVTICRLVKGKGVDIVLRALKILSAREIPFRYAIGGYGPERGFLEVLVDELQLRDKVHFTGAVDGEAKWSLLRNADVYVMPSRVDPSILYPWQESFGIAFTEAAVFGVPAIGSRGGGIPDAVVDGETGILIPEESPEHLADALTFFYRNPEKRKEMGRHARERARNQFSPVAIATRFREVAAEIAANGIKG